MNRLTLTRRAVVLATLTLAAHAHADTWPNKPISLVVPFPPGGTTDVLARALAEKLTTSLGQTVIVESKPGAGATLGADFVAKSKADGYTLLMGAVHHTIAPSVFKKLPYDLQKDFAPITTVALVPNVLTVSATNPAKNVAELVALAKAQPGQLNYGSNGNGTAQHLIGTQFELVNGIEITYIPYSAEFKKRLEEIGAEPVGNTPEQMAQQMRADGDKFAKLVKDAKVVIE
jgi:tripartite-type tricarboxylate transporter receptor subunit TctC